MRKHFLILMLLTLLPLAGFAEDVTLLTTTPQYRPYDGIAPSITVKATAGGGALNGTWSTTDGVVEAGIPTAAAGTYTWTETVTGEDPARTATFIITKAQVVYYLTGGTYAVGDEPDVTRHYSLANPSAVNFPDGKNLEYYATFDWADSGNDKLDLDDHNRFTKKATYNITALKVVPVAGIHQNYDFRFTSTATIVVAGKSIAGFVADPVAAQQYTGEQITPDAVAIYATAADSLHQIALNDTCYTVSYGENKNVAYDTNHAIIDGGTIIYTGVGNYEGTLTVPFKIVPRKLAKVDVDDDLADSTYTRKPIVPVLTGKVHGKDSLNTVYNLVLDTDFTVNYNDANAKPTNVNAGNAVGKISLVEYGNFTLATNAVVDSVEFEIEQKNLDSNDIVIKTEKTSYAYTGAQILPAFTATWTTQAVQANDSIITTLLVADSTAFENIAVGKGYIKIVPDTTKAGHANYKGFKTLPFDIIPTDLDKAHVTITLQKQNQAEEWVDATYAYVGREIKPGTDARDGRLLVKTAANDTLKVGVDYEIVSYGDNVTINTTDYTGDNYNASKAATTNPVAAATRGTVTIKGIGNYGAINALSEPITKSQIFEIAKRKLTFTADSIGTTFGVAPVFTCTNDAVEGDDLGGMVTYPKNTTIQKNEYNGTQWGGWVAYTDTVTALKVTDATPVQGSVKYQYTPTWIATGLAPQQASADTTYSTQAQIDARVNYDLDNIVYKYAPITVNNAKLIIVLDDVHKKYMVADSTLAKLGKFTYKVYNGTVATANLVANQDSLNFFNNDCRPVIGRTPQHLGENVVNGGYVISVLNDTASVAASDYGLAQNKVAKTGYSIEFQNAKLIIEPFPITLTANDQSVEYGDDPNTETLETSKVKDVNGVNGYGEQLTVTFSPVMYGNQTLINRADLGLTLTLDESYDGKVKTHTGVLIPSLTNPNFTVTDTIKGNVLVVAATNLLLSQTDDDLAGKIAAAKAQGGDKFVKFDSIPMLEKEWYAMVLPFETTPLEVSTKLNTYVVVNVLKSSSIATDGKVTVNFGLEMDKIEAGVPFLIKPAKAVNWENADVFEAEVTDVITDAATTNATFSATYATGKSVKWGYELDGTTENPDMKYRWLAHTNMVRKAEPLEYYQNIWYNCKSNKHDLVPMEAFLILDKTATGARIFVEDFENGTTAIKSLNADEINGLKVAEGWYTIDGIKLQSMPTEKGVYINNGKKVVIK